MSGPLAGTRVVSLGGIGPGPYAGMLLADLGCDVIRVDRIGSRWPPSMRVMARGQRSLALDLKSPNALPVVRALVAGADALIEGFRPGVAERLGVGPDDCLSWNPALIYARMTGWGQVGPMSDYAGHDLSYIALNGVLDSIGPADGPPVIPINLLGDFAGGGMLLALGLVSAMLAARASGAGQVIDAAMVDGSALLAAPLHGVIAAGRWPHSRGKNYLDGAAPFYNVYRTADDKYVTIAAIEPELYSRLVDRLGWKQDELPQQWDEASWPAMRARFAEEFVSHGRDYWTGALQEADVCFAPVLSFAEAAENQHLRTRATFIEVDGVRQPAPAPRFSRTPATTGPVPAAPGEDTDAVLRGVGLSRGEIQGLRDAGVVA
jgi:alpha-methylacyl-CoA racemase